MALQLDIANFASDTDARVVREAPLNPMYQRYGGYGDNSRLDDAAFAQVIADLPAEGGIIQLTHQHRLATKLNFDGKRGVVIRGIGGNSAGATTKSMLTFTQGGSQACISARDSLGVTIEDVAVGTVNTSFTGKLIDASGVVNTAYLTMKRMLMFGQPNTAMHVDLNNLSSAKIEMVTFLGGQCVARGISGTVGTNVNFSNGVTFDTCKNSGQITCPFVSPGDGWSFVSPVAEPLADGSAAFVEFQASGWAGCSVTGGGFYDANALGTWFFVNADGGGLAMSGNLFGDGLNAVLLGVSSRGNVIHGNKFAFCQSGITIAAGTTVSDSLLGPNHDTTCVSHGIFEGAGVHHVRSVLVSAKDSRADRYGYTDSAND